MSTLKELFDAEQQKIGSKVDAEKKREDEAFNAQVLPVVTRVLDIINADPDIAATYELAGEKGGYFVKDNSSTDGYAWSIDIVLRDPKDRGELGRTHIELGGKYPENVSVRDASNRGTELTYNLSASAAAFNASGKRLVDLRDEDFQKMEAEAKTGKYDQQVAAAYHSLAENIVKVAGQNSKAELEKQLAAAPYGFRYPR